MNRLSLLIACAVSALWCTASHSASPQSTDCPALAGTYAVDNTDWMDVFHQQATGMSRPKGQVPQRLNFQPRGNGYTMNWHMPRSNVVAAAQRLAEGDPEKYNHWLNAALRAPPPASLRNGGNEVWFNNMAYNGPVFHVEVELKFKQCEKGWFLFGTLGRSGPPDVPGGMDGDRDAQLWLQRGKDGRLAMRWRERRKLVMIADSRYTREVSMPLWSGDHLRHWPAAPDTDLSPLVEAELPPRGQKPKCMLNNQNENLFFDRMDTILPPKATHINRARGGLSIGRMRPDGSCEPMIYWVTIGAKTKDDLSKVEAFLMADPFLSGMDLKEIEPAHDGTWVGKFKMRHVPP